MFIDDIVIYLLDTETNRTTDPLQSFSAEWLNASATATTARPECAVTAKI